MEDFAKLRTEYKPKIPKVLGNIRDLIFKESDKFPKTDSEITKYAPNISKKPFLQLFDNDNSSSPLKVGVVFSGGQAPGGHNVISGIFDAIKAFHSESKLFGFLNGPDGIVNGEYKELNSSIVDLYRNQGGFDMIGSGRTKIETDEQFQKSAKIVKELNLDGLIIIGGDDSNTNAALLAEYFINNSISTSVIGVPKTIDGDLKNEYIEISFGFDTATKVFSEIIGNLARDALSARKYYFFVKLMGRTASHIALECALKTHPNYTLISEEVSAKSMTLNNIVNEIALIIQKRAEQDKNYGIILIPEGLIEFIPEVNTLIQELNNLLANSDFSEEGGSIANKLSKNSADCYNLLPSEIQKQLILDRDPHGNVQVSKIETERLLINLVEKELSKQKSNGFYKGSFNSQSFFCGYEGRCSFPSNFDAHYCYALGQTAALLIKSKVTGYIASIKNLIKHTSDWTITGTPISSMMKMEKRKNKFTPVIEKALVDLESDAFKSFTCRREEWKFFDDFQYPGPMQLYGPEKITDSTPLTMQNTLFQTLKK